MKPKQALKLQAYLDGELSGRAARRVAAWLAQDPEAQALANELRQTKALLAGYEPDARVPESREFYWSKIARAIATAEVQASRPVGLWGWLADWRRALVPVSGLAVALVLALALIRGGVWSQPFSYLTEVETLSEHALTHSFRAGDMFVVWIEPRATLWGAENPEAGAELQDLIIQ
jgi:anti-sigma factor RsiW